MPSIAGVPDGIAQDDNLRVRYTRMKTTLDLKN